MRKLKIGEIKGYVTNIDTPDSPENYASELRGLACRKDGMIATRDFGTLARLATIPLRPNAFKAISGTASNGGLIRITATSHGFLSGVAITGCANNGSGLIRVTSATHGFNSNEWVKIASVTGTTEANGLWQITKIDANTYDLIGSTFSTTYVSGGTASHYIFINEVAGTTGANGKWVITVINANTFDLVGSTYAGAYSSGGIASKTPINIISGHTFVDTDGTEYEIVVGLDSSSIMRIYVYDSEWVELTRYYTAKINGTPTASSTEVSLIAGATADNVYENSVAVAINTLTLNNWIVVNTSQSNETALIVTSGTFLVTDTVLGSNGLAWVDTNDIEIYRFPCFKFNYTSSVGATPLVRFLPVEAQRKVNMFYEHTTGANYQGIQIMKRNARNFFNIGGTQAVGQIIVGASLAGGDYVQVVTPDAPYVFEYSASPATGLFFGTAAELTTAINTNILDVTAVNASGTITITMNTGGTAGNALYIIATTAQLQASNVSQGATSAGTRNFEGGAAGSTYTRTLAAGWYCESDFGILNPFFVARGTAGYPVNNTSFPTFTDNLYDKTSGRNWGQVYGTITNYAAVADRTQLRGYITVTYNNYQESDPVWQGFIKGNTDATVAQLKIQMLISFALMNKEITSINFYSAMATSTSVTAGWADSSSDYVLTWVLNVQDVTIPSAASATTWTTNTTSALSVKTVTAQPIVLQDTYYTSSLNNGNVTIQDQLNHAIDKVRTYPTPRFGVRAARPQGSISVIDEDDLTLRLSNRNGDNVNEDDNFSNVSVDNDASKLKVFLNGTGELLGLGILNDQIQAFKKTEREWIDLQSGLQGLVRCDFVAKNSLVLNCPHGLAYAGDHGIYLLPKEGGDVHVLNGGWQNLYDGTLMVTGVTPYVTSAYRQAIVGGYNITYDSLWFVTQLNTAASTEYVAFVYSFSKRPLSGEPVGWYQRKLNIGTNGSVKYFSGRRSDGSLTIGYGSGILQYPNRAGSFLYQDDVLIDGASTQISQNRGIPMRLKVHCGSLYDILTRSTINTIKIDYSGSSITTDGTFNLKCYKDTVSSVFETKTFPVDDPPIMRQMPPVGAMERFTFQIDLTEGSANEYDIKNLDISTVEMIVQEIGMIGNR